MGHEINYCSVCHEQIRWQDVQSGQAFKLEDRIFCLTCGPDVLRSLPKERVKEIFQSISVSGKTAPAPEPSAKVPKASGPRRDAVRLRQPRSIAVAAGLSAIILVGGAFWLLSPRGSDPVSGDQPSPRSAPPQSRPLSSPKAPPEAPSPTPDAVPFRPVASASPSPPERGVDGKEQASKESLRKAREWAAANPSDFDGSIRKFQDACFVATGTSVLPEANKEMELLRGKQREFFAAELMSFDPEVNAACTQERFMKALDILGAAKTRHSSSEWQLLVGKRAREVNDSAFRLLNTVKQEALEARDRGDEEKLKILRARVASWGVARLIKEFREAVDQ